MFWVFVLFSCTSPSSEYEWIEAASIGKELNATIIDVSGQTQLMNIQYLTVVDDQYLLVLDEKDEGIFQVLSIPSLDLLYSWGRRGRGPGEFMSISYNSINVKHNQIIIYRPGFNDLEFYSVTDTSLNFSKRIEQISSNHIPLNFLNLLQDSLYVSVSITDTDSEFKALVPAGSEPAFRFGTYPENQMEGTERLQAFYKIAAAKPDGKRLAAFYLHQNKLKIFDNTGNEIHKIAIHDPYVTFEESRESSYVYRSSIYATDAFIYVLAPNVPASEAMDSPEFIQPFLEIWDWEGNQLQRFRFDRLITDFSVSEKQGKVYGISVFEMNKIFEYDLSELVDV